MNRTIPPFFAPRITLAKDQSEYEPIIAAVVTHPEYPSTQVTGVVENRITNMNTMLLAFKPTDIDRILINEGENIYVSLLTFGRPMQPIIVSCDREVMAKLYGIQVEP